MSAPRFSYICHTKKRATLAEIFRAVKLAKNSVEKSKIIDLERVKSYNDNTET